MVWMFRKASVEPSGIKAMQEPMNQVKMTALAGMCRLGETYDFYVSQNVQREGLGTTYMTYPFRER